ncbi:transglycosylase SLT domain-containing protein [Patescibacteria group bacterium AH-259-L05]|nr:transglycosylase SLT domain-containing protein [Patescibacteria group bacterium AH-259-L05]
MVLLKIFKPLFNKRLIHQDKAKRTIHGQEKIGFPSPPGYYLIVITARAKSEKQLGEDVTDDEDLIVKIDNKIFPKLNSKDLKDSPAAFSGGTSHDSVKTIYFLTFLHGSEHTITLLADKPTSTATFESLEIYRVRELKKKFKINPNIQAEDGDRRPWLTFVLDSLPLRALKSTITYSKRKQDSDDVKVKIDGEIQTEIISNAKRWFWKFSGSRLTWESPIKTQTQRFWPRLGQGLHYIEFDVDRMPIFRKIVINFGKKPPIPEPHLPKPSIQQEKAKVAWEFTNLRKSANTSSLILAELKKGENVTVLEKAIKGERPVVNQKGNLGDSDRWHKVQYKDQQSYIYSQGLEIEGEDKETIIQIIKRRSEELKEDANLMLAVAQKESKFFPYAVGWSPSLKEYQLAGKGVMQINDITAQEIRDNKEIGYDIKNIFDVEQNIEGGIRYFKYLRGLFQENDPEYLEKILISWYCGLNCIDIKDRDKPVDYSKFRNQADIKKFIKDVKDFYNKNTQNQGKISLRLFIPVAIGIFLIFGLFFQFNPILKIKRLIHQNNQDLGKVIQLNSDKDQEVFYKLTDDLDNNGTLEEIDFRFYHDEEFYRTEMKFNNMVIMDTTVAAPHGYTIDIDKDGIKEVVIGTATGVNHLLTQIFKFENQELKIIPSEDAGPPEARFFARGGVKFIDYDDDGDLEMRVDYYPHPYDPCTNSADIYEYIDGRFIKTEEIKNFEPTCRKGTEEFRG